MFKQILKARLFLATLLILTLISPGAFARDDDRGGDRSRDRGYSREDNRGYNRGSHRGNKHYYRNGRWYRRGWFGWEFAVSALAIGAFIDSLPPAHTTVVVEGSHYYHDDRHYFRQRPEGGYIVVQPPMMVQPQSQRNYDDRRDRGGDRRN